ncbi:DUF6491 family protein [Sphingosinicella sp. BN140058]|uniref:DUF6491 family protein n=1 Tax=Sphingosinicella sp. BN140058 TaxID=1892855 RepID=UPI0010104217|nr:DUF6491 family protein [Sphingosinicella sp. BN140058]QAY79470.1 hypothetical protein ETR14_25195 [Sphingosinicella sp. BN140058]
MKTILCLGAAIALAGCAGVGRPAAAPAGETTIPAVAGRGVLEWRAGGEDLVFIRSFLGKWYRVQLTGRCARLDDARGLGFETSPLGELDRNSTIIAEGERCPVSSIVRIDAPPPRKKPAGA